MDCTVVVDGLYCCCLPGVVGWCECVMRLLMFVCSLLLFLVCCLLSLFVVVGGCV